MSARSSRTTLALEIGLIRLLEYMLQTFSPMAAYRPSRVGGLPQEGFDVSRVLAHLYLRPLDEEFDSEGQDGRYTRWVDDIAVGADTWDEALRIVQRIQSTLEGIGLYPNSAKTRIISGGVFSREYMKSENDWLGEFEDTIKSGVPDIPEFGRRLRRHLEREDRPRAWPRVLRRYYTYSRRLRHPYLLEKWPSHIDDSPDSARSMFDYLATYRLTAARFNRLLVVLDRFGTVYEDIEILAHEYLALAPSVDSVRINGLIADWAYGIVEREAVPRPRIAAAACVTLGKFADGPRLDQLARLYGRWKRDTVLRTQTATILLAAGRIDMAEVTRLLGRSQLETIENLEFLIAVAGGEKQAVGMALSAMEPVKKYGPDRVMTKPRLMFLAPLLRASAPSQWTAISGRWKRSLGSNPDGLRDHVAERWLFGDWPS